MHRLDGVSLFVSSDLAGLVRVLPTIPFRRHRKIRRLVLATGLFDYTECKMNGVTD